MSQLPDNGMSRREFIKRSTVLGASLSAASIPTLLSACGGGAGAGGKVQLNFWDMLWGPDEYIDAAKKLVSQFNQQHSNIEVTYQSIPWTNWYQTFTTAIGSGTAPDVSTGAAYQAVQFYDSGAIAAVDDVIEEWRSSGKLDDFQPHTVDTLKYNGHYVALPWGIDIRVPFYRKDYFQKAGLQLPTNWDEWLAAAKKLTGAGKYGWLCSSDTGGSQYLYLLILNNGGGFFTPDKKPNLLNDRDMEALQFFSSWVKNGTVSPASTGYQSTDAVKAFGNGDGAMIINSPGMKAQFTADVNNNIGVMPPLAGPHGDKGTIFWVNNLMLYKQSQHPNEAKTFMKWWSENQLALWTQGHSSEIPARKSFASNPYFKSNADLNFIIENWVPLGKTTATQASGIFPQLNSIEGEGVLQTLVQDLLQGKNVAQASQTAQAGMQSIMNNSAG
jgi:multiple sugar transport system substrate-binding protein